MQGLLRVLISAFVAALLSAGPAQAGNKTPAPNDQASACTGSDDAGCRIQANSLFYQASDPASRGAALKLFESACKARKAWGCMGMADAYANGWGVTRDAGRAAEYQRIGCIESTGDKLRLCTLYGARLVASRNQKELNLGEQILNASCAANDGMACYQIGQIGFAPPSGATTQPQEALYYSRRGCELGNAGACTLLGEAYAHGTSEIDAEPVAAIPLLDRACKLGDQAGCDAARLLLRSDPQLRQRGPGINPAAPAAEQLQQAKQAVASGDPLPGLLSTMRLVREGNEDAEWLMGGWMYYGLPGYFGAEKRGDGLILFENAARVGHIDAAVFMGMAYWYGDGVEQDRAKGERYMGIAASRGSQMAAAILRSMKAEGQRQDMARRQREYEEWQASRANDWSSSWANYTPTWSAPTSSYNPTPTGRSVSQIYDEANFNNAISYYSGGTSYCAASNRYC